MGEILVVDDEETVRRAFQAFLEEAGHHVETAESPQEARLRLADRSFDVLITDLMMPRESGLSLVRSVAEFDPQTSVVMVTGHPDFSTAVQALKQGAYDYLTKPVSREALLAVVERACERKHLMGEKLRLEHENADYQRSLERKVEERTRALSDSERRYRDLFQETRRAYDELKHAQEKLIRSERLAAIGELAAQIAHEIRNPLSAISNSIGVLRRDLDVAGDDRRLLEVVYEETHRLAGIVTDFLKYARPRPVRKIALSLSDMLNDLLLLLSQDGRAGDKIRIVKHCEPGLPAVELDPDQARDAVWNLLMNAVQSMPDGGELRVEARQRIVSGTGWMEIAVSDTGKGIEPEEHQEIWKPFHTTKAEGTGLGLAIVQRVMDEHGGEVLLESAPGTGSTFVLRFLLTPQASPAAPPREVSRHS